MPRMTITLSEQRQQAVREAAARRGTTIAAIIDESLEACGVKSWLQAEELVAQARARAGLAEDEAVDLAVRETSAVRRVRVVRETSATRETSAARETSSA